MRHYYDTAGPLLPQYEAKAGSQDALVLAWYEARGRHARATPSECHDALIRLGWLDKRTPLTSTRRAISNLTKCGELVKQDDQRRGPLGRPEHYWRLNTPQLELI